MTINGAILGMLSYKPMTGYDLKKAMQDSSIMYWSGNNNQIYKALVALHESGYVTSETHHQDGAPSRKVYTITAAGLAELRRLTLQPPEPLEMKKPLLVQLAYAWQLRNTELTALLKDYARTLQGQLLLCERKPALPDSSPREQAIWAMIDENVTASYRQELAWVNDARLMISQLDEPDALAASTQNNHAKDDEKMTYQVIEKNGQKYIFLQAQGQPIGTEQDALDLLALCIENGTNLLLIHGDRLPDAFFQLKTGLAGAILQKFAQYNVRSAVVLDEATTKGRFKEFLMESNRGKVFRSFVDMREAEDWLLAENA